VRGWGITRLAGSVASESWGYPRATPQGLGLEPAARPIRTVAVIVEGNPFSANERDVRRNSDPAKHARAESSPSADNAIRRLMQQNLWSLYGVPIGIGAKDNLPRLIPTGGANTLRAVRCPRSPDGRKAAKSINENDRVAMARHVGGQTAIRRAPA